MSALFSSVIGLVRDTGHRIGVGEVFRVDFDNFVVPWTRRREVLAVTFDLPICSAFGSFVRTVGAVIDSSIFAVELAWKYAAVLFGYVATDYDATVSKRASTFKKITNVSHSLDLR